VPDNITFQTSVTATPPNATSVATDEVSGVHYQYVKLAYGDDGTVYTLSSGTPMPIGTIPGGTFQLYGTAQVIGTFQQHGTGQIIGTVRFLDGSVHVANVLSGTFQVHGTVPIGTIAGTVQALGTFQIHGTTEALGTLQPLAGSVHPAAALPGTSHITGTVQPLAGSVHLASGTVTVLGTIQAHGTTQALGTIQTTGTVDVGTVRFIVGTVHVGTVQRVQGGTINSFGGTLGGGTIQTHGTNQVIGTVQAHGTNQALGTFQPLAGSAHLASNLPGGSINAQGVIAHGAAIAGNPLLFAGFGSSGTQAAVDDGDLVRAWFDLNGRLQIRGTIDSMPAISVSSGTIPGGTVQLHGTSEILGTVRALTTVEAVIGTIQEGTINSFTGTAQVLGTIQALLLAGSVQGWQAHGGAAAGNPLLFGGFGSSGTQAAVDDGDAVRAWFDLNGRLQVRGTIDSMPPVTATNLDIRDLSSASDSVTVTGTVQSHGTVPIGTVAGTVSVLGTVQSHGTVDIGTVRFVVGTVNIGTMQAGSVHVANTAAVLGTTSFVTGGTAHIGSVQQLHGTVAVGTVRGVLGTVLTRPNQAGEGFFGTVFTGAAAANGTVVPNPGQGTFVRVWDLIVSGSAAGSAFLELGDGTIFGHVFTAANGGFSFNSSKGARTNGTNQPILFTYTAGSWGVSCNYTLETL
jgi:hypothetical protein